MSPICHPVKLLIQTDAARVRGTALQGTVAKTTCFPIFKSDKTISSYESETIKDTN